MEELTMLLQQLAEQLGTTVEFLWGVLLKQARVEAIMGIFYSALILLNTVALAIVHLHLQKVKAYDNMTDAAINMIIWLIISLAFLIIMFCELSEALTALLNPEYWALMEIMDKL